MAYTRRFWVYPVAAVLVAALIIGATAIYMNSVRQTATPTTTATPPSTTPGAAPTTSSSAPTPTVPTTTSGAPSTYSALAVELTDPPQVPPGTEWLNMTFTQIALLVGEPTGQSGQIKVTTVTVTPKGGSMTVDLLALQNYTETLAVANLTNGSVVYSVTFTVSSIRIDINGTQYNVTLAGGSSTLQAVIANPRSLVGDNQALIQLNPVVVYTPTGYELIPSTVAVVAPTSKPPHEGGVSKLSGQEEQELEEARGNLTVQVLTLTAHGNTTVFVLQVNNTGSVPVQLVAVALHGSFNVTGSACAAGERGEGENGQGESGGNDNNTGEGGQQGNNTDDVVRAVADHAPGDHGECEHPDEVVFVPVNTSTTTSANLSTFNLSVVGAQQGDDNSQGDEDQGVGITIQPNQSVRLVFNGTITFGESNLTLVPSLTPGSTYTVHIIASNGAEQKLDCTVPVGPATCTPAKQEQND